jgi:glycosyltransferase involved in cell wall biosynthesis
MKILITQETDWLKRNPAQQHHLAEMLSLRGHEIRVIDYELMWKAKGNKRGHFNREIFYDVAKIHKNAKVTVIRPGTIKVPWLDYMSLVISHNMEIKRQIREFAPDVIIGFGILNSYLAAGAAKKSNIPFISYWIDVLHRLIPTKILQPVGVAVERMALRRSDMVLVINEGLKDVVMNLGAFQERTHVLRAGINDKQFNPSNSDDSLKRQLGLTKEDIVLFFMGWLYRFSGLKEVAMQLTESENRNVKLLIVGEGDSYEELKRIQIEHNLQNRLILAGKKSYQELPGFISVSDVCLLPAYPDEKIMQDIVPIKLYEYMAMQKPVVSTKLPGVIKEFGESHGVVYVDRPEDTIQKAAALVRGNQAAELGLKAREFATRNSWQKITDELEALLEKAIKSKKG